MNHREQDCGAPDNSGCRRYGFACALLTAAARTVERCVDVGKGEHRTELTVTICDRRGNMGNPEYDSSGYVKL
jgi:hypothetical protein